MALPLTILWRILMLAGEIICAYDVYSWVAFIAIAFFGSRFFGWIGMFLGHCAVAGIILFQAVVQGSLGILVAPGSNETPHLATVPPLGLVVQILFINSLLLIVTSLGFYLRKKEIQKLRSNRPKGILVEERKEI